MIIIKFSLIKNYPNFRLIKAWKFRSLEKNKKINPFLIIFLDRIISLRSTESINIRLIYALKNAF